MSARYNLTRRRQDFACARHVCASTIALPLVSDIDNSMKQPKKAITQATISSYFQPASPASSRSVKHAKSQKRPVSSPAPIDLTLSDSDEPTPPPKKKTRKNEGQFEGSDREPLFLPDPEDDEPIASTSAGPLPRPRNIAPQSPIQRFRFEPNTSSPPQECKPTRETLEDIKRKESRREAFKKRLLVDNNLTFRKKQSRTVSQPSSRAESEKSDAEQVEDEEPEEVDKSYSSSILSKAFASAARTKKPSVQTKDEIGPSGQVYTPLEKQVRIYQ